MATFLARNVFNCTLDTNDDLFKRDMSYVLSFKIRLTLFYKDYSIQKILYKSIKGKLRFYTPCIEIFIIQCYHNSQHEHPMILLSEYKHS
jgi:hypothetical protein